MTIEVTLFDKKFKLQPYTTKQEKEILLQISFNNHNIDDVFDILNFDYNVDLSDDEKKVILYKYREISVGDEVDIKFNCDECGQGNDGVLNTSNFYKEPELNDDYIRCINKEVTDDNLQDFIIGDSINVDELELKEFDALKERIIKNQPTITFDKDVRCLKCGATKTFDLSDTEYILDIMSDDSLMTLYKTYNFLIFFSHYTKSDIDDMLPFERSVFVGLLNKTKEDLSK